MQVFLWVLEALMFPHPGSVAATAALQVIVTDPVAGDYTVEVIPRDLGDQTYALTVWGVPLIQRMLTAAVVRRGRSPLGMTYA